MKAIRFYSLVISFFLINNTHLYAQTPGTPGNISGTTSMCEGSTATFYISPVSGAESYVWIPSGGPVSIINGSGTTQITLRIPEDFPTEQLQLKVYGVSSTGNAGSYSPVKTITVYKRITTAPGSINGPKKVNIGESHTYSISPVPGVLGYAWIPPSGTTISVSGTSCTITFLSSFTGGTLRVGAVSGPCGPGPYSTLDISRLRPDFIVTGFSFQNSVHRGENIDVTYSIANIGEIAGNVGESVFNLRLDGWYLANLSAGFVGNIDPGETVTKTVTITIPFNIPDGDYLIRIVVNNDFDPDEIRYSNNQAIHSIDILPPIRPDFRILNTGSHQKSIIENEEYQHDVWVWNEGTVTSPQTTISIYNDYVGQLGTTIVPPIQPGFVKRVTTTFIAPSFGVEFGTSLFYEIDKNDDIYEINETNNKIELSPVYLVPNLSGRVANLENIMPRADSPSKFQQNDESTNIISIVSLTGKIIWTKKHSDDSFEMANLNGGFYIVRLLEDDKIITNKIFVNK